MIREHVVPRTNLYDPDFDHEPLKNLKIKETRITHVQFVTGRSDVVIDQWSQPGNNQVMKKWVGQTIFFVDKSIPKIKDNVCLCAQDVPSMPKGKWLLDTGSGHDLISQKMVGSGPIRRLDNDEIIAFATANGRITTEIVTQRFAKSSRIWWSHSCCRTRQLCCPLEGAACEWAMAFTGIQGRIRFS